MNMSFVFVDTYKMRKTAENFEKTAKYTTYEPYSYDWEKFWKTEKNRRVKGVVVPCRLDYDDVEEYFNPDTTAKRRARLVKDVYVTGNHYAYLNYGRMDRVPTPEEKEVLDSQGYKNKNTIQGFPTFRDCDWWYFIIDQFVRDNQLNLCVAKARRKGYSYKIGNTNANEMNLYKDITICNAAYIAEYLVNEGAIAHMTREAVQWYEQQTYWKRGFNIKTTIEEFSLGYQDEGQAGAKNEWSVCKSRQTKMNTSAFIGSKAYRLNNEECGKFNNLYEYLGVTMSLMESGAVKVGTMTSWGTAGTKGANWADFENMFRNSTYNGMRFENVWDVNRRTNTCGFFHPQVWGLEPFIDGDGNSMLFSAYAFDVKDKYEKEKSDLPEDDKIIYLSQRANCPDEAFINTTVNIFASEALNRHIQNVRSNKDLQFYKDGWYEYDGKQVYLKTKEEFKSKGERWHEYITDVPHRATTDVYGCVREFYPPFTVGGEVPDDMYFITIDPTGVDKDEQKDITEAHSLYCFQVWARSHSMCPVPNGMLVASYCGRLPRREENDKLALYASIRYNAKVLCEVNRGETVTNFKKWKQARRLLKDPTKYFTRRDDITMKEDYGITIMTEKKYDGLKLLKDSLYDVSGIDESGNIIYKLEYIIDLSLLLELQSFNAEGNFDRISCAIISEFEKAKDKLKNKQDILQPLAVKGLKKRNTLGKLLTRIG